MECRVVEIVDDVVLNDHHVDVLADGGLCIYDELAYQAGQEIGPEVRLAKAEVIALRNYLLSSPLYT